MLGIFSIEELSPLQVDDTTFVIYLWELNTRCRTKIKQSI